MCSCREDEKNQYVIQADIYELVNHISQHVIDECLENCLGVGQPKRHDQIFKPNDKHLNKGIKQRLKTSTAKDVVQPSVKVINTW